MFCWSKPSKSHQFQSFFQNFVNNFIDFQGQKVVQSANQDIRIARPTRGRNPQENFRRKHRETHSMMNIIQNKISGLRGSVMDSSVRTSGRGKHLDVSAEPCYKRMNNHHHHAA